MNYYVKKALRDPQFMLFFVLAVILILIPILAPWIAPNDPIENDYANLMTFLVCEKKKDFVNSVSNNKTEAEKVFRSIEKMTGLTIDKKRK